MSVGPRSAFPDAPIYTNSEVSTLHIMNSVPTDVFVIVFKNLDSKQRSELERVCKKLYELVHLDRVWSDYLTRHCISVIPTQAKFQVVRHARTCCRLLISLYGGDKKELSGKNVFEVQVLLNSQVSRDKLEKQYSEFFKSLSKKAQTSKKVIEKAKLPDFEAELMFYVDSGLHSLEHNHWIFDFNLSDAVFFNLCERVPKFTASDVESLIRSFPHAHSRIISLLKKVQDNDEYDILYRILSQNFHSDIVVDEALILTLVDQLKCNTTHLECALKAGYSESCILKMLELLQDDPSKYSESKSLIHGAFYARSSQRGKAAGEVDLTYSEQLICTILERVAKIESRYLEAAIDRRFSDANLKKFVEKCDSLTERELRVAAEAHVSEDILLAILAKLNTVSKGNFYICFSKGYSEKTCSAFIEKVQSIQPYDLQQAVVDKKYSAELIRRMIPKVVGNISDFMIIKAKEYNYPKDIIEAMKAKCPNPPSDCIIS